MPTENDLGVKVDTEDCTLSQNFTFVKLYWFMCLKSTKKI